ncbi:hypothetical protein [Duganella fentianensis]|uniref:hypothetical protein n=1 Tax=Duganella fentianensis TaxID=2692177 RepID=UPI0032B15CCA
MANSRFLTPADNSRPYKSHRYDVFGLKVERVVTLFGTRALMAWIRLEADPLVKTYCERPLVIPDIKPKRVLDFWVDYQGKQQLWLLRRPSEADLVSPEQALPAFASWAATNKLELRFIGIDEVGPPLYLDNWGRILRDLAANRRFVSAFLKARILENLTSARPLSSLCGMFPDEDPVLLRAAAYQLLHNGKLRCSNLDQMPLGPASIMEPT